MAICHFKPSGPPRRAAVGSHSRTTRLGFPVGLAPAIARPRSHTYAHTQAQANRIVTGLAAFPVGRPGPTRCGPSQPPCSSNATQPTVVVRCVHRTTQGHKSRRWAEQSIVNPRLRRNNTFKQRIASRPVRPICPQDGTPGEACASVSAVSPGRFSIERFGVSFVFFSISTRRLLPVVPVLSASRVTAQVPSRHISRSATAVYIRAVVYTTYLKQ